MSASTSSAGHCPACGADNDCALATGREPRSCWCWHVERRAPLPTAPEAACYCPRCFARLDMREPRRDR